MYAHIFMCTYTHTFIYIYTYIDTDMYKHTHICILDDQWGLKPPLASKSQRHTNYSSEPDSRSQRLKRRSDIAAKAMQRHSG